MEQQLSPAFMDWHMSMSLESSEGDFPSSLKVPNNRLGQTSFSAS